MSTLECFGLNEDGQRDIPVEYKHNAMFVDAGEEHTCAINRQGVVECWGFNDNGECDVPVVFNTYMDDLNIVMDTDSKVDKYLCDGVGKGVGVGVKEKKDIDIDIDGGDVKNMSNKNRMLDVQCDEKINLIDNLNTVYMLTAGGSHNCAAVKN